MEVVNKLKDLYVSHSKLKIKQIKLKLFKFVKNGDIMNLDLEIQEIKYDVILTHTGVHMRTHMHMHAHTHERIFAMLMKKEKFFQ